MRMRARASYKLLTLFVVAVILVIICINYVTDYVKSDDFLSELPVGAGLQALQQARPLSRLLNLTDFSYNLSNDLCRQTDKELLAIMIITSYVGHDELRAAHRAAISKAKLAEMGFQRVFLLAEIPANERFINQQQLLDEQSRFGDLLQGNFQEAYRNLSYKHIMGLHWAAADCSRAKFIVKLDDDIVFDVFQLRRYLEALEVEQPALASSRALLAGYVIDAKRPIRNVASKWYVSPQEFAASIYPNYLSGWLYITNSATALRLVAEAQNVPFFWIDDTWVTGLIRERLQIPMERLNSWYSANAQFLQCCLRDLMQNNYECEYYVGPNGGDAKLLVEFLHNVEKCYFDECIKRAPEKSLKQTCVASAQKFLPDHGDAVVRRVKLRR